MISIVIANMLSFWVLTKVALMVGEDASRYFYPVINVALPFMAYTIAIVFFQFQDFLTTGRLQTKNKAISIIFRFLLFVVIFLPIAHTYQQGKVLFLYNEDAEKIKFSEEHKEYPLMMVYNSDVSYRSWYVDNQLWPYEKVFYVENDSVSAINDSTLFTADKIVVYMDAPVEILQQLIDKNPNLNSYQLVRQEPFFYIYLLE